MSYADYYERALTNGVLSIQKENEPGAMIYMLPLGHGVSKGRSTHGWGTQFNSFWCCYGTGFFGLQILTLNSTPMFQLFMVLHFLFLFLCFVEGIESFSKLGDSIYFEEEAQMPQLYVIQYIPSSVDWASTQISLIQIVDDVVSWDQSLKVKIQVSAKEVYHLLDNLLSRIYSLFNRPSFCYLGFRDGYLELSDSILDIFERPKSFS